MPARRARASSLSIACGSSERLPEVRTIGRSMHGHQQVMERRIGQHDPDAILVRSDARCEARAFGFEKHDRRDLRLSAAWPRPRSPWRSAGHRRCRAPSAASGLDGRCLRRRSSATAVSFVASQARWKPPMPLIAPISPAFSRRTASEIGSRSSCACRRRPQAKARGPQTGQALGWAWKRRSAGSPYSWPHSGHMAKARIEVCARS